MDMVSPAPRRHERRSDPPLSSPAQAKFVKLEQKWVISLSISVQKLLWLRSPLSIGWWKINKLASILHRSIRIQSLDPFVFSPGAFVSLYFDPLSHLGGGAPPEPRPSQECLWRCTEREPSVHAWHVQANKYKYEASSIKQIQIQRMFYYTFYRLLQLLPWNRYHRSQTESFGKKCHLRTDER